MQIHFARAGKNGLQSMGLEGRALVPLQSFQPLASCRCSVVKLELCACALVSLRLGTAWFSVEITLKPLLTPNNWTIVYKKMHIFLHIILHILHIVCIFCILFCILQHII